MMCDLLVDQKAYPRRRGRSVKEKISSLYYIMETIKTIFHLRITSDKESGTLVVNAFIKKFKPLLYIFGYEEVTHDDGTLNKHLHGHIEYDSKLVPSKQNISDFFKKHKLAGKYYHKD